MDDDDEREWLDGREAQEEEFGSRKQCANMIMFSQVSKRESSTRSRIFFWT